MFRPLRGGELTDLTVPSARLRPPDPSVPRRPSPTISMPVGKALVSPLFGLPRPLAKRLVSGCTSRARGFGVGFHSRREGLPLHGGRAFARSLKRAGSPHGTCRPPLLSSCSSPSERELFFLPPAATCRLPKRARWALASRGPSQAQRDQHSDHAWWTGTRNMFFQQNFHSESANDTGKAPPSARGRAACSEFKTTHTGLRRALARKPGFAQRPLHFSFRVSVLDSRAAGSMMGRRLTTETRRSLRKTRRRTARRAQGTKSQRRAKL